MKFYKRKKVIITGGAGGLGRELVKMLHNFGSDVTSIVSNTSDTTDLQGDIFRCDFNNISAVTELTKNDIFNNVDILINCAGIFPIKTLEETSIEEFDKILNINLKTPFVLTKRCIKTMKDKTAGLIVNIGSSSSYNGSPTSGGYCVSKHGLLGLTRSLHKELKKYNIRALIFSPGSIKTKMGKTDTSQDFETFLDPVEIAEYILFCCKFQNEMFIDESRMNRMSVL